jgi:hypothetical protein
MLQQNSEGKHMSQGSFCLLGKLEILKILALENLPNKANNQSQAQAVRNRASTESNYIQTRHTLFSSVPAW